MLSSPGMGHPGDCRCFWFHQYRAMWVDALLASGGKTQGGQELLTLGGYLELDKGILLSNASFELFARDQGAQGLAGSRRTFPQSSFHVQSWALSP